MAASGSRGRPRTRTLPRSSPIAITALQQPNPLSSSLFFRVSDNAQPDTVDRKSSLLLPPESMSPHARALEQHHQCANAREDETLRKLALEEMEELRAVVDVAALAGKWQANSDNRRSEEGGNATTSSSSSSNTTPTVDSRATAGTFSASSSCALPCSVDEVMHAVSTDHMDHWNAAMVELFGSDFSYGVKVRDIATDASTSGASNATIVEHLSLKIAHFRGAVPLLSSGSTVILLDFVQRERGGSSAMRVVRSLREDPVSGELRASGAFAGYFLQEDRRREHTVMFVHAAHRSTGSEPRREGTTQRLHKLASSLAVKTGELVLRRRLGAARERLLSTDSNITSSLATTQLSLEASATSAMFSGLDGRGQGIKSVSDKGDSCGVCGATFSALQLKKRRECALCGRVACGACAASRDVEERIGLVFRARVCVACVAALRRRAFAASASSSKSNPAA